MNVFCITGGKKTIYWPRQTINWIMVEHDSWICCLIMISNHKTNRKVILIHRKLNIKYKVVKSVISTALTHCNRFWLVVRFVMQRNWCEVTLYIMLNRSYTPDLLYRASNWWGFCGKLIFAAFVWASFIIYRQENDDWLMFYFIW